MRNFCRIAQNVDVGPLMLAVTRQSDLWNADRYRTSADASPFRAMDDILLRYSDTDRAPCGEVLGDDRTVWHPAAHRLPELRPVVLDVLRRIEAYALCRMVISRMAPGARFEPHFERTGAYAEQPGLGRYHLVLQGLPGSLFTCGDETVNMRTGELWWFAAHVLHEGVNNSPDDRVHLLLDALAWPA